MNALIEFGDRMHRGGRNGFHPLGMLLCLVVIAGIVALAVWAFRSRGKGQAAVPPAPVSPMASPTANAESILAERLARGEVSPEDYRVTLAALRGTDAQTSEA